jgi:predicted ATP-grasp superfamily ATP-dependent carboligase
VKVWLLASDQWIAATSRYTRKHLPWPRGDEDSRVAYLLELSAQYQLKSWSLIPTDDDQAALIARHLPALSNAFRLASSPWEVLRWSYDKRRTCELAARTNVAIPWTCSPHNAAEIRKLDCNFPLILKPAIKDSLNRFTYAKAWRISNHTELRERYQQASQLIDPALIMIQELIPGGGDCQFSYGALCREGAVLASVVARRARQYPVDFGRSSSYVELIEEPEVEFASRKLITQMRYTGLLEAEFKRDPRDGKLKLLDLNPRVWGWHTLATAGGVDFPYLFWMLTQGQPVPEIRGAAGARWVRMITDLPAALAEFRAGHLSLRAYLKSLRRPLQFAVFARDDPAPALLEAPLLCWWKWSVLRAARAPLAPETAPAGSTLTTEPAPNRPRNASDLGLRELPMDPLATVPAATSIPVKTAASR